MPGKNPTGRNSKARKTTPSTPPASPDMIKALESIIGRSPAIAILWRSTPGTPIDYISPNIRRFGYEPEDFTSGRLTYFEAVHPDDRKRVWDEAKEYADRGIREYRQRYRFITRSGEVRWIDDLTFVPTDDAGRNTHIQGVLLDVTEQQASAEALLRSEERYRSVVEDQTELICRFTHDCTLTFVNEAYCRYFGKTREELEGVTFLRFIPDEDRAIVLERLARLSAENLSETYQHRVVNAEGKARWQEWTDRAILDGSGVVVGFQSIGRDITHLKEVEEALRESEERYRNLYGMVRLMCDNVPDLIWAKDLNKRYVFTNRAMCEKLLGALTTGEPMGKTDMFFAVRERAMHPENPHWHTFGEICADSDTVVITNRKPMRFDEFGNVKGKFLFLDVCKAPFWDEHGEMIGTVGCGRDVTHEKQMEKQRQAAEASATSELAFRKAIEASMDAGVVTADMEGRHTYANAAFTRMTGWTGEELFGQPAPFVYWPEEEKEKILGIFRAIYHREAPPPADVVFMHKNGARVPVRLVFSPLVGGAGEQLGWMAVVHDQSVVSGTAPKKAP